MKRLCMTLIGLVILYSCISNPLDSKQEDLGNNDSPLRTLLTKSAPIQQEDSLVIMSRLQKDVNYLMMMFIDALEDFVNRAGSTSITQGEIKDFNIFICNANKDTMQRIPFALIYK